MSESAHGSDGAPSSIQSDPFQPYDDDRRARQSRWRIVFGSLSLVVGVMGFCMQGMGTGMVVFGGQLSKSAGFDLPPPPAIVAGVTIAQFAVLVILGIALIAGATMLLRRNPAGRSMVLGWVVARLIMVVVGLALAVVTLKPTVDWQTEIVVTMREQMRRSPNVKPEQLPPIPEREAAEAQAIRGLAVASILFATWPFVMAIVLTRPFVRQEIESWRLEREGAPDRVV